MNKTEMALLYFPDHTPKVAVRHLMRWITRCAPQLQDPEATGYRPHQKTFTCRQRQTIFLHLGWPQPTPRHSKGSKRVKRSHTAQAVACYKNYSIY